MTARDAVAELVAQWPRLPELVGPGWSTLRPRALEQIGLLASATTDAERRRGVGKLLRLFLPHPRVGALLAGPAARDPRRTPEGEPDDTAELSELCRQLAAAPYEQWISAVFEGHPPGEPFEAGRVHTLAFTVDRHDHPFAFATAQLDLAPAAGEDSAMLDVTLHGDPDAVTIRPVRTRLTVHRNVPASGPEAASAVFEVTPRRTDRPVVLMARFTRGAARVSQVLRLTLRPAGPVEQSALLPPLTTGDGEGPDISITLMSAGGGHQLCVQDRTGAAFAPLPHGVTELSSKVREVRRGLGQLLGGPGGRVYATSLTIPKDVYQQGLRTLAQHGVDFFRALFRAPGGSEDLRKLGDMLLHAVDEAEKGATPPPRIEIVSDELCLPWHLMYIADRYREDELTPTRLLGLGSRVTLVPLSSGQRHRPPEACGSLDTLRALLAVNSDIDRPGTDRPRTLVSGQLDYWRGHLANRAETLYESEEVTRALVGPREPDALWYFYCHLEEGEDQPSEDTRMVLTGDRRLWLRRVRNTAPYEEPLSGAPLVVLNTCESAPPWPVRRAGFPPYFLAKGARGVVCTEAKVPMEFGTEWARRFFDRLLAGVPLGTALHQVSHELLTEHHNLLGLLYTAHGDSGMLLVRQPSATPARQP
ncbi:CHAT domain-containing protein [Streptomyces griseoruber]|uniref:CHAT domain-containing protein n=1 Tax=Streptomyces griseoruber TaxID=1943 RepID=UPI0037B3820F